VTSARRLYRLSLALGLVGGLAVVAGLLWALRAMSLALPSAAELALACGRLLPKLTVGGGLVIGVSGLAVLVLVRSVRSLLGQLREQRAFLRQLRRRGASTFGGVEVLLVADERPQAFCAGYLRPSVFLSTGALRALEPAEVEAVIRHERHHQARRDPLRILLVRVLADGLFFLPVLRRLADRYTALAELAADEAALGASRDRRALASALLTFGGAGRSQAVVGIAPERVDHLFGDRPRWRVPAALLIASLLVLAILVALLVALVRLAGAVSLDLPALVAQSCMLSMALVPLALGLAALRCGKPLVRRRRSG
jgi:beta-lactamase regulating signal transducer with metallopeptidase domain